MTDPGIPEIAYDILEKKCDLIKVEKGTKEEILEKIKGVDALFWAMGLKLDAEILDAAGPQMKTVATMSAGYDHIDISELKKRGIKLGNTRGVLSDAVADTAILLALGASRRLHEGRLKIDNGEWTPGIQWMLGTDIKDSTVGIIGLGSIGTEIAKRVKPFGVKTILYTSRTEKDGAKSLGAKFVNLEKLNKESDFIFVAVPLTNETRGLIGKDFFSKTKKNAVFVNIARGEVVDQEALIDALRTGKIFAAGLDVVYPEPLPKDHDLLKLPNVVIMPHLGSATVETKKAMAELTALNILRGLGGEEMFTPVV
ncbi:glyoxylate reductase/hydroxypyruvate reductase isoform X2 [Aethina tumida]|nr:glyoxylate reductase/hydroxypyruvate reductase isoform X2 [Aethina tumida]